MINALLALLAFQLTGEVLVRALGVPVPGPVVGMLLLFVALRARGSVPEALQHTTGNLLSNLSLLFVPAGVGISAHLALLRDSWWQLLLTILLSTLLTLLVTALVMRSAIRVVAQRDRQEA